MISEKATEAAERTRREAWDGSIPVDPVLIAHRLNLDVSTARLDADVAGAIEARPGGRPLIFLSEKDPPNRKRFTCAHEIGHYVDHREKGDGIFTGYIDYRDGASSKGYDYDEQFANAFAAALLMPEGRVRFLREEGLNETQLAARFGVSEVAMVNRLKNLDLYR